MDSKEKKRFCFPKLNNDISPRAENFVFMVGTLQLTTDNTLASELRCFRRHLLSLYDMTACTGHACSEARPRRSRVMHHMHAPHCQQHRRCVTHLFAWIRGHYSFRNLLPLPKFAQVPHSVPRSHMGHSPECEELRFKLRECMTTKGDPQQCNSTQAGGDSSFSFAWAKSLYLWEQKYAAGSPHQ